MYIYNTAINFLQDYQRKTADKIKAGPVKKKMTAIEWGAAPLVCNTWRPLACANQTQSLIAQIEGRAAYT